MDNSLALDVLNWTAFWLWTISLGNLCKAAEFTSNKHTVQTLDLVYYR